MLGGGATITVQEGDVTVDSAVTTLDFGTGLDVTSSPAGEANVVVDPGEITHNSLSGLTTGDPHTQYALLAGRAAGDTQTWKNTSGGNHVRVVAATPALLLDLGNALLTINATSLIQTDAISNTTLNLRGDAAIQLGTGGNTSGLILQSSSLSSAAYHARATASHTGNHWEWALSSGVVIASLDIAGNATFASVSAPRTRRVFMNPMSLYSLDHAGTSVLGASFPNYAVTKPLNVGAASPAWYGWLGIPKDYASGGVWKLYICGDGTAANDAVIDFHVKSLVSGVVTDSADIDSIDNVLAISGTANTLSVLTVSDATGVAAGEMARIALQRDTAHGSDTYAGACYLVGIAFEYTADM